MMSFTGPNLLPDPAQVHLFENFLSPEQSSRFFLAMTVQVRWQSREIVLFGRKVMQPRLVSWQGDPGCSYRYSGVTWDPDPWAPAALELRERVSGFLGVSFNGVLLNQYRNGLDSMGWHSDDEPELGANPVIASVSLGADRRFLFRNKGNPKEKFEVILRTGSLLVMRGETQSLWQHALPRSTRVTGPRINLTFRKVM